MAITFQAELFEGLIEESLDLTRMHYDEIAPFPDLFKLNPDLDAYRRLSAAKILHAVTARDGGKLIGYVVLLVKEHIHYKDVVVATDDMHFLHPNYRSGGVGYRMLKFADALMPKLGARVGALRTKVKHNHGILFERMGYEAIDVVYMKRLDTET